MLFHRKDMAIIYNNSKNIGKMFWLILFFCGKVSEFLALAMTKGKVAKGFLGLAFVVWESEWLCFLFFV